MAFSRVQSAQLTGLGATKVTVETDINRGLYSFQIVGLPDKAVEESRERVISALRNSLNKNPKAERHKVIVSLSPAELKKEGAYFDMAIAVGYLIATGTVTYDTASSIFVGELALNGDILPIRGMLSIAQWAKKHHLTEVFIPSANSADASLIEGVQFYPVETLQQLVHHLEKTTLIEPLCFAATNETVQRYAVDMSDVHGQDSAKRALLIAAAGGHNIVLYGPPGTGKTMLAKAFHSILPPLSKEAFLEVATIYSSVGQSREGIATVPPIRAPHHSASHVAIIGGGQYVRPGDITLAHRGVLYMDEFPEFDRRVLEALREPLEDGYITVARAKGSVRYPARFILLAAMNPCPCGYRGSGVKHCQCSGSDLVRYTKKLSGPIMDRIDLWVPVAHIQYETLHATSSGTESDSMRTIIERVQNHQQIRNGVLANELSSKDIDETTKLSLAARAQLQQYAEQLKLSPRSYVRAIKVARTIADIEHSETIEVTHILEALQYRPKFD